MIRTEAITASGPCHNRKTYVPRSPYRSAYPGFPSICSLDRYISEDPDIGLVKMLLSETLRYHRADLYLQFATWEAKAVCKIHDRMFVVQNGKPLGMRHLAGGSR